LIPDCFPKNARRRSPVSSLFLKIRIMSPALRAVSRPQAGYGSREGHPPFACSIPAGRRYIIESGQSGPRGPATIAINVDHGPNLFSDSLRSKGLTPEKFSCAKLIQVDNLMRRVSTSLMRTGIVRALNALATSDQAIPSTYLGLGRRSHITHAIGRSRAEVESDSAALLESITRARNHREIA
jgi:hypothetical protein